MIPFKMIEEQMQENVQPQMQNVFTRERETIKRELTDVYPVLQDCNAILAGGALTSIFSGKEINDFDIYFKDKVGFTRFLCAAYGRSIADDLSISSARIAHHNSRSILVNCNEKHVQLIGMRLFETPQDIFDSFDFTINMCSYDFASEQFIMHTDFLHDLAARRLVVNTNTAYPLVSVLRVDKYRQRGYEISKAQMFRLLLAVNKKSLSSWKDIEDELGGLYGLDPKDVLDQTKEFSLDEAMSQLTKMFVPKNYENLEANPDLDNLLKAFEHVVDERVFEEIKKCPYYGDLEFL